MTEKLTWGIPGTGTIAETVASGLILSQTGRVLVVGSCIQAEVDTSGEKWNTCHRRNSYAVLIADKHVPTLSISTPHLSHARQAIKAAEAGKNFADPIQVPGSAHIGLLSRIDEYATAMLTFPRGILAQLLTAVQPNIEDEVWVFDTQDSIPIPSLWLSVHDSGTSTIVVNTYGEMHPGAQHL